MSVPVAPSRFGRALGVLGALAVVLAAAFVVVPPTLAGDFADERDLREAFREAFVEYWRSGARDFSPALESAVDYWFWYHVTKGVIAALLLIVFVALGVLLWRAFLRARGLDAGRNVALASSGMIVTALGVFSLLAVMANVQGAVAPYASLLPMLTGGDTDGELAETLDQVRQRLAESLSGGGETPALAVMISDFSLYHVAMAVIAAVVAIVLLALNVVVWKRFARATDTRARRVSGSFGVLAALSSLASIVVVVANTTTAADPGPALSALFDGGW
ncbi:hypothetical protein [Nocardia bhagyanarayanae]|uniref:Tat (Twin-arginine translocation) pathway signal sequence n=1 Tax=Nocardia bhagyanarayanae TaxID=1215925 RepID=A0A543FF02_9NOCA|nr:hypothetical protein [Nocardia bhagyanarayanae]TQM32443.1 hypothetical protein FB390_4124 [Nocardia bhagyanarayanae]